MLHCIPMYFARIGKVPTDYRNRIRDIGPGGSGKMNETAYALAVRNRLHGEPIRRSRDRRITR